MDSFSLMAFVVAAILRFFDSTYEAARIILSLNIIVFIVRSLQIVSVNRQLGPKLVMIRKMVRSRDLKYCDFKFRILSGAGGSGVPSLFLSSSGPSSRVGYRAGLYWQKGIALPPHPNW